MAFFLKNFFAIRTILAVSEAEFLRVAEEVRPYTEVAMKIEPAPWLRDYYVDMDKLYCDLTLEKIENEPAGHSRKRVSDYRHVFTAGSNANAKNVQNTPRNAADGVQSSWFPKPKKANKVLAKGDPGIGKTTLAKKVAWDWARALFTKFSLVLFVFLKLVNPGSAIEAVIIEQNPCLEGLNISEQRLEQILRAFGNRCLLILDGLDEHIMGSNQDVLKIIQGRKFLECNIFLTSHRHSTTRYEQHFDTVLSVEGFTKTEAEKFANAILKEPSQVKVVLEYNPSDANEGNFLYQTPILLSFLCMLVKDDPTIDLSSESMDTGAIYTRMTRHLYKKFTIRKGIEFVEKKYLRMLRSLGKLAWETLLSGKPLTKRSEVIKEAGPEAFDYGLLIGNEDFRIIKDEACDILVTFPHRTIQEFLAAFYLLLMLSEGRSPKQVDFSDNPLFFSFCLWFIYRSQGYFDFLQAQARRNFVAYVRESGMFDQHQLILDKALAKVPFLKTDNDLHLSLLTDILSSCRRVQHLVLRARHPLSILEPKKLKTLKSISITDGQPVESNIPSGEGMGIVVDIHSKETTEKKDVCRLSVMVDRESGEFTARKVVLRGPLQQRALFEDPFFLSVTQFVLECLSVDSKDLRSSLHQRMPCLTSLALFQCELRGKITLFFGDSWPKLKHLGLDSCGLTGADHETVLLALRKYPEYNPLPNLESFFFSGEQHLYLEQPKPFHTSLTSVSLQNTIVNVTKLAKVLQPKHLIALDLSRCRGIFGDISSLLSWTFPVLESLRLSDCALSSLDLLRLAFAGASNFLPKLKELDVCYHEGALKDLFEFSCKWNQLASLNVTNFQDERNEGLVLAAQVSAGSLRSLEELGIHCEALAGCMSVRWQLVHTLRVHGSSRNLADHNLRRNFPLLSTVLYCGAYSMSHNDRQTWDRDFGGRMRASGLVVLHDIRPGYRAYAPIHHFRLSSGEPKE